MALTGYYYLHANGELIFKKDYDAVIADFRESDLVIAFWPVDSEDREMAWTILVEALALGAKFERVLELATKWNCDDTDADEYAKRIDVKLERDGDHWCATGPGFINPQESKAGFGVRKLQAMAELAKDMGLKPTKMWGAHFDDLLKAEKMGVKE